MHLVEIVQLQPRERLKMPKLFLSIFLGNFKTVFNSFIYLMERRRVIEELEEILLSSNFACFWLSLLRDILLETYVKKVCLSVYVQ